MKFKVFLISIVEFSFFMPASAQQDFLAYDYQIFGRKEPASLGSLFGSLGTGTILVNPANVALVTDNRISSGGVLSDIGNGYFISWMAPNLSVSSASQKIETTFGQFTGFDHEKQLFRFDFGLSSKDLGFGGSESELALGVAVKRQADRLLDKDQKRIGECEGMTVDLGLTLRWKLLSLEFIAIHLNNPELDIAGALYGRRSFVFGGRLSTAAGLTIALQGIKGESYIGSDFGLNLGAEQTFFEHRLITRVQLTSFFLGPDATMQNVSSCIGYRLSPGRQLPVILTDLEFCYALSFLSMPKNVGTHMLVISKYF